ncbi:hypothetical_protein [Leishmania braziliensis MHOM/BR/75/M2904]|uniref:Hypothetical_protein n=1 Tax=Leishmania braziliensis MHOM/BR/75/M2904 TaxID=420245 RepID=A0A3P3ZD56_LEIBR|nr:hypothetical_protein [Leishmania braziliensis MHOM/BR/75/M2904]
MLSKHLRSPVAYAQFRSYTRDFMESAMLTSKYYDVLARECFPNPQVFHGVFPLIVATVPVAAKQAALQEVHKMRMAPEMQRIARAREEDARKEAEARTAAASAEEVRNCKAEKNNSNIMAATRKARQQVRRLPLEGRTPREREAGRMHG